MWLILPTNSKYKPNSRINGSLHFLQITQNDTKILKISIEHQWCCQDLKYEDKYKDLKSKDKDEDKELWSEDKDKDL